MYCGSLWHSQLLFHRCSAWLEDLSCRPTDQITCQSRCDRSKILLQNSSQTRSQNVNGGGGVVNGGNLWKGLWSYVALSPALVYFVRCVSTAQCNELTNRTIINIAYCCLWWIMVIPLCFVVYTLYIVDIRHILWATDLYFIYSLLFIFFLYMFNTVCCPPLRNKRFNNQSIDHSEMIS